MTEWYEKGQENANVRLFINGERTPIINDGVTTYVRKEGPCDINRFSKVKVPIEWDGEEITQIPSYNGTESDIEYKIATIGVQYDKYFHPIHEGVIKGVGGGKTSRERTLTIADYSSFLSRISASKRFTSDTTVKDVINYVRKRLNEELDFATFHIDRADFNDQQLSQDNFDGEDDVYQLDERLDVMVARFKLALTPILSIYNAVIKSPSSFSANKHTLEDVVEWLSKIIDAQIYFEFRNSQYYNDVTITVKNNNQILHAENVGSGYAGYNPKVIKNNAIQELQPINQLTVDGRSKSVVRRNTGFSLPLEGDKYPSVTVKHTGLVKRAGGELKPPKIKSDVITLDEAEQVAKETLKKKLNKDSGGEIVCNFSPDFNPHKIIETKPACDSMIAKDTDPFKFDIESVVHRIPADGTNTSTLRTSLHVKDEDIEVVESKTGLREP